MGPLYMNDVFKLAGKNNTATKTFLFKLSQPYEKTNHGQKSLSYVARTISNKLPASTRTNRVKQHFFYRMNNEECNIYSFF